MRFRYFAVIVLALVSAAFALDGQIGIHDPSTIIQCDGKYYTFGTGGGGLVSDDGWTWRRGASRPARRHGPRRHPHRRPLLPVYMPRTSERSPRPTST